jgi:hypothetical protein
VPWHLKPRSASIFFLVSVVLPTVLQAVASVREVLELQVSAAEHSVYSGIVYRCSISACKVEGFNGGCVYIYMYLSIHTHIFFLKVWGRFPCYLLHFGAKISHLHAHLAFGFWLWLHLASLGFWLLAFGFWPLASLGFWFLLVFGFCLQVVSRHRHS